MTGSFVQGLDQEFDPDYYSSLRAKNISQAHNKAQEQKLKNAVALWEKSAHSEHTRFTMDDEDFLKNIKKLTTPVGQDALNDFFANPQGFLILQGDTGLGKTSLAVALGTYLIQLGDVSSGELVMGASMLDSFSQYNPFSKDRQVNPVEHYSQLDLLVIDDIGMGNERITDVQEQRLSTVIDNRWGNNKVTIMTTNMGIHGKKGEGIGLSNYFTKSTWDRFLGSMYHVNFSGQSLRTSTL